VHVDVERMSTTYDCGTLVVRRTIQVLEGAADTCSNGNIFCDAILCNTSDDDSTRTTHTISKQNATFCTEIVLPNWLFFFFPLRTGV
jgi:hypothetical protein